MKNLKCKVLALCMGASVFMCGKAFSQVPSYVPSNGLVGWWPFNGNANDESGNGNNGTVNGATLTTDRFGVANKAFSFDGTNWISFPSGSSSILNIIGDMSLSLWFKTLDNQGPIVSFGDQNLGTGGYLFGLAQAYNAFGALTVYYQSPWQVSASNNYNNNLNYHAVITLKSDTLSMYIDGIKTNEWYGHSTVSWNGNRFVAKSSNAPGGSPYAGDVDDIGIWNRALTECEIQDLYNSQLGSFSNANVSVNPTSSSIGSNSTLTVNSTISSLQWQSNPGNMGWNNVVDNGIYNGANNDTLVVSNLQLSNHNQPFRVLACGDTSNVATIQIADTCITNVTVYDTLYTTVTDTLIINTTLSLPAPNNENTILIYPNPASDHITIDNGNFATMAGYSIKIENNAGQQVFQSVINQQQFYVDLSTWSGNGLYFVHLIDPQNNTVTVRKIVLQ